ncbi:MAG TPA: hypothetical protein VF950_10850 [Planctomycetota bacterium]
MRRPALWAGLALTAPCVVLLAALPVGFVMELGKQIRLRIVNRTTRPVRVTVVGVGRDPAAPPRVAAITLHPILPLPAFRAVDLLLEPGASRTLFYSGRQVAPRLLAVRDAELAELPLPPAAAKRDVETGREIVIDASTPLAPASEETRAALDGHTQAWPWAVLLAGPLGTFGFFRFRRALTRA